jgi:hypothetical protein
MSKHQYSLYESHWRAQKKETEFKKKTSHDNNDNRREKRKIIAITHDV